MLTIQYLADCPDEAATLARWFQLQWPDHFVDRSLDEIEQDFRRWANRDDLAIALVAFEDGIARGTVTVARTSIDTHQDLTPWIGGLYVEQQSRRRGIGTALVERGMSEARRLGFAEIFAGTGTAVGLFKRLGWREMERAEYHGAPLSIMRLGLTRSRGAAAVGHAVHDKVGQGSP